MEIQWTLLGVERRCTAAQVDTESLGDGAKLWTPEGAAVHVRADAVVTVLAEPQLEEPSPGSVVRTPENDMFCRTESKGGSWQRVNGTGATWTWGEIRRIAGDPEILFDPEADIEQHGEETPRPSTTPPFPWEHGGVPTHIETPADWDNWDTELRKYPWVDADGDTWTWNWANETWMVVNEEGYARYRAKNLVPLASFPIKRVV